MKKLFAVLLALIVLASVARGEPAAPILLTELDYAGLLADPDAHRFEKYDLSGTVYRARKTRSPVSNWDRPYDILVKPANDADHVIWILGNCPEGRDEIRAGDAIHFLCSFHTAAEIAVASGGTALIPFFVAGTLEIVK